jgi:hypothetical protein
MPFAAIDYLWQTGLAGSIVNFFAFLISSVVLFSLLKISTQNILSSWFGYLIFVTNFNILYFQTTSMTESMYICFLILFVYYLFKWSVLEKTKYIFYSSIFSALAAGTRYDAWPIILTASLLVILISLWKKINFIKPFIIYSILPFIFIIAWFVYNYIVYGDALEFSRGQFSTLHQLKYYEDAGRLLTKNNFFLSMKVALSAYILYSGLLYFILALTGFIIYFRKNKFNFNSFIPYLFVISLPVTIALLYLGQLIIETPDSVPPGYFNSRYGLYILPGICFFSAYVLLYFSGTLKPKFKKILYVSIIIIFIIQFAISFAYYPCYIPALREAEYNYTKTNKAVSFFLKENYEGGNLLYDNVIFALYPWSGINLKDRISFHTQEIGEKALKNPLPYAKWVMLYTRAPNDNIYIALNNNSYFRDNYSLVFSEEGIEIYKRKF